MANVKETRKADNNWNASNVAKKREDILEIQKPNSNSGFNQVDEESLGSRKFKDRKNIEIIQTHDVQKPKIESPKKAVFERSSQGKLNIKNAKGWEYYRKQSGNKEFQCFKG